MKNRTRFQPVNRRTSRRRGSVLVEASAAVLMLLVPLMLGIIQFGMYYNATNVLSQVSREGGRYAAVYASKATDGYADIKSKMVTVGQLGNVKINPNDITVAWPEGIGRYKPVRVTVSYNLGAPLASGGKRLIPLFNPGVVSRTYTAMSEN